jgi:hypothetical protein
VWTREELQQQKEKAEQVKERLLEEAEARKARFDALDKAKAPALSDLEKEAKEKSEYLLEKAKKQLSEQENEIKYLNELILNAKCVAIRDLQMEEKVWIF